ncbi:3205_t:CDS:1 [Cetraspora pellucida]|uniref:3205_t:CDS:1 n=1 Tax=Cetraspora pellucida TaxID=1433469 RepID=A0A9N9A5R1_9GLOM|nr:3205_t:CDS:1 [Cetraspora pellucida]
MYIKHFVSSISSVHLVLLMLDGHKSHINYTSIKYCSKNGILLYALLLHITHILQPFEIPFAKLKLEYGKSCDQLYNNTGEVITKHMFARVLSLLFIVTYIPKAIRKAFSNISIWLFNSNAISFDHLDPSLITEHIDSNSLSSSYFSQLNFLSSFHSLQLNFLSLLHSFQQINENLSILEIIFFSISHQYSIQHGINSLKTDLMFLEKEIEILKKKNKLLKRKYETINKKLKTFKNSDICLLKLALKYPTPCFSLQTNKSKPNNIKPHSQPTKKRKTLLFAKLFINETSLWELNEAEELVRTKAENVKRKKDAAG